jgi:hypothetical protein
MLYFGGNAEDDLRYRLIRQGGINQHALLDWLHPLQARMPVVADDDVVMDGNAERGRDVDDRLGHLDVGLRGRRIAGGVVVLQRT